jgi:prepilin-type N-terminal cleavage/methylation domain-containing protein
MTRKSVECLKYEAGRMAKKFIKSLIMRKLRRSGSSGAAAGFTLLELLIVALISGLLISGLMYLVVELLTADQRESSRTETQRDMQMALDYMSTELKEAVYVYSGACIAGVTSSGCPAAGLAASLPAAVSTNSTPVLAFWKQQLIPSELRNQCAAGTQAADVPCITGNSYSLVVYSLSTANPGATWQGRARITRYALTQFTGTARTAGYGEPTPSNFGLWTSTGGRAGGTPAVLVDFVDDAAGANTVVGTGNPTCPADYLPSPVIAASPTTVAPAAKSFFACVNNLSLSSTPYRDVVLFLRGSVFGRPGFRGADRAFLPALEARVLTRGVLQREPARSTGTL